MIETLAFRDSIGNWLYPQCARRMEYFSSRAEAENCAFKTFAPSLGLGIFIALVLGYILSGSTLGMGWWPFAIGFGLSAMMVVGIIVKVTDFGVAWDGYDYTRRIAYPNWDTMNSIDQAAARDKLIQQDQTDQFLNRGANYMMQQPAIMPAVSIDVVGGPHHEMYGHPGPVGHPGPMHR